ncbi:oxygen-independent coproporphyrinogen III oxidase [Agriterribacter sp.]|uniref:oxygen-independent coproporphyrinogen III oxidase n=1 Tax=Agriterribacter sp. TaxID=2821509 RepID=UPI002C3EAD82|nr:oxygen-independent coproporphyrinogen III oxidase [Agriterribacter sp.]HRP55679.1 oxygen-independent coproporphyrinogen III oxidase [Agriterribacter sp.]
MPRQITDTGLIQKYNVPGPRYTSYPAVPYWDEAGFSTAQWISGLQQSFSESNRQEGISLYIHLPFCESLCTFCACNKRITKQHSVEEPYIEAVLKEWDLYKSMLPQIPVIREIHLGGGTPTFFSSKNIKKLVEGVSAGGIIHPEKEFSFEGHPNNTGIEHLKILYELGFRRVSFGVQDYNEKVQKAIHRVQPFENVKRTTLAARETGFESISHDLVFGLPFQTLADVRKNIALTLALKPGRIALYSYAHVPWIKGVGQRGFDEADLPPGELKLQFYKTARSLLKEAGYTEIGMDHFSLPSDGLYRSMITKKIHRNFMGYTSSATHVMIGLGVSAISDSWYAFAQNEKTIEEYYKRVHSGASAIVKGHILTAEDLIIRRHILNLMCLLETNWLPEDRFPGIMERLKTLENDALITITGNKIIVNAKGRSFLRNICMAFDLRLIAKEPSARLFSMTV